MIEEKTKVIPMTYDVVFKSVLQDKKQEEYLVDILSNIIDIPKERIKGNIRFKNTEFTKDKVKEKGKMADLLIELKDNVINLEMNKSYYDGLYEKNDRYVNKIVDGSIKIGEKYKQRKKVIQINFDNFEIFDERIIIKFRMMDEKRGLIRSDYVYNTDVEIYHINLKRINKKYYNKEKLNTFERELLLMTLDNKEELLKVSKGNKVMEEVTRKISSLSEEEQMQGLYIKEEQDVWIKDMIRGYAAKKGFDEGIKKGEEKGIEKGKEDGIIIVAKNLIKQGINDEVISFCTGLSISKIKELKNSI